MLGRTIRSSSCPLLDQRLPAVAREDLTILAAALPTANAALQPPPPSGPALPSPEHTARSIAPHTATSQLHRAAADLTPQERLALAPLQGDQVAARRLRDLMGYAEQEAGVAGMTALLRALAQDASRGGVVARSCVTSPAPSLWPNWQRGEEGQDGDSSAVAGRVRCLHQLAHLWPRWQRGQGIVDLVQALQPGAQGPFDWVALQAKTPSLLADKGSFRALETAHMALLELRLAPLVVGQMRPNVPALAELPAVHADTLVHALKRCPPKYRHEFAGALLDFRDVSTQQDCALLNALPALSASEWGTFMRAIGRLRHAAANQASTPAPKLLLHGMFAVARLGCEHAALFARFWDESKIWVCATSMQTAQLRWLQLRDLPDLQARVEAALQFAEWAGAARHQLANALLKHFFDPALQDPTQYIALLGEHGAERASHRVQMAMLMAPRHLVPWVALVGSGEADLLTKAQAAPASAQAVAGWLRMYDKADDKHLVLNIARRMPVELLPALTQIMRRGPREPVWLAAVHACSTQALTRFTQRGQLSGGPRGWLQLAACALPDMPPALQPPNLDRVAGLTSQPTSLRPFKELLRYLPTDAHRAVWTEDTRLDWPKWRLEQVEYALRLAHAFSAEAYGPALLTVQRLRPWAPTTPEALAEILALPETAQADAARALALFGTPATPQRQRLARLILDELVFEQVAATAAALARLTAAGGRRPSDPTIAALLLQLTPQDRGKILVTMAAPAAWSWSAQAEFLARVPVGQRTHVAELLHYFCAHADELPATPEARAGLLAQLNPLTASRVLQGAISVMMRAVRTPPDLTLLVHGLNRFQDANARLRAVNQVRSSMSPAEIFELLTGQADLNNAVGTQEPEMPAQEPILAQVWADDENVMLAERRAAVGRCVEALVARYPTRRPAALDAFLMRPLSVRARRLITDVVRPNDEALQVTPSCSVDTIMVLGTVLRAIADWRDPAGEAATQTGHENMWRALERNLERCWEQGTGRNSSQWHPVCLVGQIERMVLPLHGYDPDVQLLLVTPRELVNEMAGALQARRGDAPVSEEDLQTMLRSCHRLAHEMFAGDAERIAECDTLAQAALVHLRD